MNTAIAKYRLGIESLNDIIRHKFNKMLFGSKKSDTFKWIRKSKELRGKFFENGTWNFNGIKLPEYINISFDWFMYEIYMDIYFVYCNHNDDYDNKYIDQLDKYLYDGTFGYKNNEIDVTVKEHDIVIDAGAWIGDFSAYASKKGAYVYAFEPSSETVRYLVETQKMNPNISIIQQGLGNEKSTVHFTKKVDSWVNTIISLNDTSDLTERGEITTLDDFVVENNIKKIDFIKSDIEGFERYMLMGATNVLKNFGPKLAICTYHLPDDPQVLSKIILDANPNYVIVQKRKKLYAMVKN